MLNTNLLIVFKKTLSKLNTKWWLDFGQLLSAKRTGKILNWDYDIDFCIVANDDSEWEKIKSLIISDLEQSGLKIEIWRKGSKMIQGKLDNFRFDFYRTIEKDKWVTFPVFKGDMKMRTFFYDELETITLNGIEFYSPRHIELYLQIRYGDNWYIPINSDWSKVEDNIRTDLQTNIKVITLGVFDLFHYGHKNLLQRCNDLFDEVTIGLHSDEVVESYKRRPVWSQQKRKEEILNSGLCNNVITDFPLIATKDTIKDWDFIVFGTEENNNKFYPYLKKNHSIKRTDGISTTQLL